jgi:hypothetical protein
LRQTASLPLFALHLAFISFSLSAVNFLFDGFAVGVGVAGAVSPRQATWRRDKHWYEASDFPR